MEKKPYPLDRLFAQKLRGHEIKPRDAAWEKLQARLPQATERRARPLWGYLAVAASVAALVLAGTWLWRADDLAPAGTEVAQATRPIPTEKRALPQGVPTLEPKSTSKEPTGTEPAAVPAPEPQVAHRRVPVRAVEAGPVTSARRQQPAAVPASPNRTPESVPAVSAETPQPQLAKAEKTPVESPTASTPTVFVLHVTEPPLLAEAAPTSTAAEPTQVAQVETSQPKKGKFLNRMVKNLKHLKQGEWKEAGLDAGGLLARAEEKILRK